MRSFMLQIGDFEIHLINDGNILSDAGGPFGLVPRVLFSKYKQPDEQNRVMMSHYCLLVKAGGRHIIVDTGIGTKIDERTGKFLTLTRPEGGLLDGLARLGVSADQID